MTKTKDSARFTTHDSEKYGKNFTLNSMDTDYYSQGIVVDASEISDYVNKSESISECNKLSKLFNGRLLVTLKIDKDAKIEKIKKSIEKASELTPSFKSVTNTAICDECGFKDEPFEDVSKV